LRDKDPSSMEVALLSPPTETARSRSSSDLQLVFDSVMSKLKSVEEPEQLNPEYRELLAEFVRMFETIPQKYCLFCEATATLGIEAHKVECPYRRGSKLLSK
jgi:hypothetical protein